MRVIAARAVIMPMPMAMIAVMPMAMIVAS